MHVPAAVQAQAYMTSVIPLLPSLAVIAVVFFALAKWGHAPMWELLVTLALGIAAYRTFTGPGIHQILSQFH